MKYPRTLALTLSVAFLAACGGGGGSSPTAATPVATTDLKVTGTAATGKAIAGATVTAKCQIGAGTATTIADGTYRLVIAGGKLPCVLQITNPADGSKLHTLVTGSGTSAVANITPLTEMLAARVLRNEPAVFFAVFDAAVAASTVTMTTVKTAQTDVGTILTGTVDTSALADFIATPLKAATQDNPTGGDAQDRMLDALKVKISGAQLTQVVTALAHTPSTATIKQVVADLTAVCGNTLGNEASFNYDWSLVTQKVTLKNNNKCDSMLVRATSAPIYTNSPNGVIDIRSNLAPGLTLVADAIVPAALTWKPSVIYSLPNGKTYKFQPIQAGQSSDFTFEILLLDNTESYVGTIAEFASMFSIGVTEDRYGACANFSWVDRPSGKYKIQPNASLVSGECYVGNIQGVDSNGNGINLPAVRYFVTTK